MQEQGVRDRVIILPKPAGTGRQLPFSRLQFLQQLFPCLPCIARCVAVRVSGYQRATTHPPDSTPQIAQGVEPRLRRSRWKSTSTLHIVSVLHLAWSSRSVHRERELRDMTVGGSGLVVLFSCCLCGSTAARLIVLSGIMPAMPCVLKQGRPHGVLYCFQIIIKKNMSAQSKHELDCMAIPGSCLN